MRRKELTFTLHIGGKQVEHLTEEQKDKMMQRLSETMSRYYTVHFDEFLKLKEKQTNCNRK